MTETTQPDPQVVAWMRRHMHGQPCQDKAQVIRAYQVAHLEETRGAGLDWLLAAYEEAARKPLTVADIPAGQGAASLFLRRIGNEVDLCQRMTGGQPGVLLTFGAEDSHPLLAHLAATLPTVTD